MRSIPFRFVPSLSLALFATSAACAMHRPPPELVDARAAVERAQAGSAARSEPGGEEARPLAYVAHRTALSAEADAAATVLFDGGTAELMATARERLDRVAQALHELRGRSISVEGYVDASGEDAHDADLSRRRAEVVRKYLVSRGIEQGRMRALGRGKADPVASDASAEGRHQNRRVEIVVEGMGQDAGTR